MPSVVVLDLLMPRVDGFEFIRQFRAVPGCAATPIVVWTVKDLSSRERSELADSGPSIIVAKGAAGAEDLLDELRSLLKPRAPSAESSHAR
jgi:CheY-like chemotaxis protein